MSIFDLGIFKLKSNIEEPINIAPKSLTKPVETKMNIDRDFFFSNFKTVFNEKLSQSQVDGYNDILDSLENCDISKEACNKAKQFMSYILATVYHETAKKIQPIHECGNADYFEKRYGYKTKVGISLGNSDPGDGDKYHGRGYVQLTGKVNYEKASENLGVDVVRSPDDVLKPEIASTIMIFGMTQGWFTGKKLIDFWKDGKMDYIQARRIINGTDRAEMISGYAVKFEKCFDC